MAAPAYSPPEQDSWESLIIDTVFIFARKGTDIPFNADSTPFSKDECNRMVQECEILYNIDQQCPTIDPTIRNTRFRVDRMMQRASVTRGNSIRVNMAGPELVIVDYTLDQLVRGINMYEPTRIDKNSDHSLLACAFCLSRLAARCGGSPPASQQNITLKYLTAWFHNLLPLLRAQYERRRLMRPGPPGPPPPPLLLPPTPPPTPMSNDSEFSCKSCAGLDIGRKRPRWRKTLSWIRGFGYGRIG
ncbi:hypothetical protein HD806DRAFT_532269 [Xylariaceae sp. AK1471]|nr:hypothetical protein HD806DRAFT_532269 [Xylariaceae sp. AK1471]